MGFNSGTSSLLSRLSRGSSRILSVCAVLFLATLFLSAQDGGGGAGGGGGGTGGAGGGGTTGGTGGTGGMGGTGGTGGTGGVGRQPGTTSPFPGTTRDDPFGTMRQDPFANRPIYLSGKVVLQEGGPAPIETVIERVCNGQPIPEGYVNSKGDFNIQLGRNSQMFSDASTSSWGGAGGFGGSAQNAVTGAMGGTQITERDLMGCEIRATLPGYRSSVVQLAGRRVLDKPDIGTLVLSRIAKVEGFTISATTLNAPKNAQKNYDRGVKELRSGKFEKAIPHLEKALAEYPQYAVAWFAMGNCHEGLQQFDKAEDDYQKAIEIDDKFLSPYLRLASLAANNQEWEKSEQYSAATIRMNPVDFPQAYYINALSNLQLQQFSKAEESAREAKKMDPANRLQRLDYFLALILANRNKFGEAAEFMKSYMKALPEGSDVSVLQQQLGQMERMALTQSTTQNQ